MKVGSYVYNVNQVIFNLLFENESYDNIMQNGQEQVVIFQFLWLLPLKLLKVSN